MQMDRRGCLMVLFLILLFWGGLTVLIWIGK